VHITAQGPPVSEMTYTVWSGTLSPTIPYHTYSESRVLLLLMLQFTYNIYCFLFYFIKLLNSQEITQVYASSIMGCQWRNFLSPSHQGWSTVLVCISG